MEVGRKWEREHSMGKGIQGKMVRPLQVVRGSLLQNRAWPSSQYHIIWPQFSPRKAARERQRGSENKGIDKSMLAGG